MAEEDEQRLFTEKVNKTFSECLNLINEVEASSYVCVVIYSLQSTSMNIIPLNCTVSLF